MSDAVRIVRDAPLTHRNTFGVPARASLLAEVADSRVLPDVLAADQQRRGAGDPDVPVLVLTGDAVSVVSDDGTDVVLRAEAGANWHGFVMDTLARGLGGIENLSLIPGTVGAAPIPNIGAYGVEVCERIRAVEAFEPATGAWHRLPWFMTWRKAS